jgi:hypothetical protein
MVNNLTLAAVGWTSVLQAWAWPLAVLLLVVSFLIWVTFSTAAKPFLKIIFGRVRRITAFGVEFDLTDKSARQTRANVETGFNELRRKLNRQFDWLVNVELLNNKLLAIARQAVEPNLASDQAKRTYRCTVHVPDALFEDALYQLLDYQPIGGGRGRARSVRFGIIGTCWRLGHADVQPDVATNAVQLIKDWAMTTSEAAVVGRDRRSFIAVPLFDTDSQPLGVFYVDAVPEKAWKDPPPGEQEYPICKAIIDEAQETGLVASLSRIMYAMRQAGPGIRLME